MFLKTSPNPAKYAGLGLVDSYKKGLPPIDYTQISNILNVKEYLPTLSSLNI